jgi:hypothetical protein
MEHANKYIKKKSQVTCFTSLSVDELDSDMRVIPVKRMGLHLQLYCGIQSRRQRFLVPRHGRIG